MSGHKTITISKDVPHLDSGSVPLTFQIIGVNEYGESIKWMEGDTLPTPATSAL